MGMRRMLAVAGCTAAIVGVGAGSAFAGEVTGNGKLKLVHAGSAARSRGPEDARTPPTCIFRRIAFRPKTS